MLSQTAYDQLANHYSYTKNWEKALDLTHFGQTLRQLRKGAGLTQNELARQLGISDQLLSIWERAYRHGERV